MPSGIYKRTKKHIEIAIANLPKSVEKEKNPFWGKKHKKISIEKMKKSHQGKRFSDEVNKKKGRIGKLNPNYGNGEKIRGIKNPNWKGGIARNPYSIDWTRTLRQSIRERDRHICQLCGEIQGDRVFDVHHINYFKQNCNPDNLITLCHNCNSKVNFNRNYWINYFNKLRQ